MPSFSAFLFNEIRYVSETDGNAVRLGPSAANLLAYLLIHQPQRQYRDVLSETFWGERNEAKARKCLSSSLWRIRKALRDSADLATYEDFVQTDTHTVWIKSEDAFWVDALQFAHCLETLDTPPAGMSQAECDRLEKAVSLYTGDLLPGVYDNWALRIRERYRQNLVRARYHLMQYYWHHKEFKKSIVNGQHALELEPLRESIHRDLMRIYLAQGRKASAVRQYQHLTSLLETELGIGPMPETKAILEGKDSGATLPFEPPGDELGANQSFNQLIHELENLSDQLQKTVKLVRQMAHSMKNRKG